MIPIDKQTTTDPYTEHFRLNLNVPSVGASEWIHSQAHTAQTQNTVSQHSWHQEGAAPVLQNEVMFQNTFPIHCSSLKLYPQEFKWYSIIQYIHWTIVNIKHGAGITRGLVSMECVSPGIIISYRGTGAGYVTHWTHCPSSRAYIWEYVHFLSQSLRTISHSLNQFLASVCHLWVSRWFIIWRKHAAATAGRAEILIIWSQSYSQTLSRPAFIITQYGHNSPRYQLGTKYILMVAYGDNWEHD